MEPRPRLHPAERNAALSASRSSTPGSHAPAAAFARTCSGFVAPAITLVSFLVTPKLSLAFRPIELIGMAGAAVIVALIVRDGTTRKWEGWLLLGTYGAFVVWVLAAGDRAA